MRRIAAYCLFFTLAITAATMAFAQDASPAKRSWFNRILHPFSSERLPEYKDPHLRGLVLTLQLAQQPVKLSEVRQLGVKVILTNRFKRPISLDFPTEQRIEIYLRNSTGQILTRWSDNRAFAATPGSVLINPDEHLEYNETIATRDLTANKVAIVEAFFPRYPELKVQQKFLTAP